MEIHAIDCMRLAIENLNSKIKEKQDLLLNGHLLPGMDVQLRKEIFSLITAIKLIKEEWGIE